MPKQLPYFKFEVAEWINGSITLEDMTTQGIFINICALFWQRGGSITLTEIKRRLVLKQPKINRLLDSGLIKVTDDFIEIEFLREQFDELQYKSSTNSENGRKGGAPSGNRNAAKQADFTEKNNRKTTEKQPKTSNIEVEEKRREEEIEKEGESGYQFFGTYSPDCKYLIIDSRTPGIPPIRINGVDGLSDYMQASGSVLNWPEYARKFMTEYNSDHFEDLRHVRNAYKKYVNDLNAK